MPSYIFMKTHNQRIRLQTHQKERNKHPAPICKEGNCLGSQYISWTLLQFSHTGNILETEVQYFHSQYFHLEQRWEYWQCSRRQQTWFWSPLGNAFWFNIQSLLKYIHYSIGNNEILLLFANFSPMLFQLLVLHSQKTLFTIIRTRISKVEVPQWSTA